MTVGTCHRCGGNTFLERLSPGELAWVCLQCGSCRYVGPDDGWPFATEWVRAGAKAGKE